jgi:hypothetical protein
MISLFTFLLLLQPNELPSDRVQSGSVSRQCPSSRNAPATSTKKHSKNSSLRSRENAGACIELSFSPLEVQEYLQAYARKEHWTIIDEHMTEDSWSFSVARSKEELLAATTAPSNSVRVDWRSGIALVQVSSTKLPDGFTRTIIRAGFRGYGESADQFAMQKEYFELVSNGSFEASVVSALRAHFQTAQ